MLAQMKPMKSAAKLTQADSRDYRDALMAATGLVHGAALVTRNIKHFEDSGVLLINPWEFLAEKSRVPRT